MKTQREGHCIIKAESSYLTQNYHTICQQQSRPIGQHHHLGQNKTFAASSELQGIKNFGWGNQKWF